MTKHQNITALLFVTFTFITSFCFATHDTTRIKKSIYRIATKISKHNSVDDRAIGVGGVMTNQYKRFYRLTQLATDNELVFLTDHKSEKVRAYAFWALAKRNFANIKAILEKHLDDTTNFEFNSGCLSTLQKVNYFFLAVLTPTHVDGLCFKLSTNEINNYYKKIIEAIEQKRKLAGI